MKLTINASKTWNEYIQGQEVNYFLEISYFLKTTELVGPDKKRVNFIIIIMIYKKNPIFLKLEITRVVFYLKKCILLCIKYMYSDKIIH